MSDVFRPRTIPAVQLGTIEGETGVAIGGETYDDAPRISGARVGTGASGLCMRVGDSGSGRAVIGSGGYYAPRTTL